MQPGCIRLRVDTQMQLHLHRRRDSFYLSPIQRIGREQMAERKSTAARGASESPAKTGREPTARDEVRARLRDAGLKCTGPRVLVYGSLMRRGGPVSHPELSEELAGEDLDRATVYRNLTDLVASGLVVRRDLGDHVWRFEARRETAEEAAEHPHFTCTSCGNVSCLEGVKVKFQGTRTGSAALAAVQLNEVQLRGLCAACRT